MEFLKMIIEVGSFIENFNTYFANGSGYTHAVS